MFSTYLNIEISRHDYISQENRICYLCNYQAIEGEFPFFMMRRIHDKIRHVYLPHLDNVVKDMTAFSRLMNSGEMKTKSLVYTFIAHFN